MVAIQSKTWILSQLTFQYALILDRLLYFDLEELIVILGARTASVPTWERRAVARYSPADETQETADQLNTENFWYILPATRPFSAISDFLILKGQFSQIWVACGDRGLFLNIYSTSMYVYLHVRRTSDKSHSCLTNPKGILYFSFAAS